MIKTKFPQIILFLISFLLLAACGEKEATLTDTDVEFVPFDDDELGVSLVYPEDWFVHNAVGGLTIVSDQAVIEMDSLADIGENGFINIIPGELGIFNLQTGQNFSDDDALQILGVYKQLLEREGQVYQGIEPPRAYEIDGQPAASMVLRSNEGGQTLISVMAVVMNEGFLALVIGGSLEANTDNVRPTIEQIINSIHVFVPTGLE